MLNKDFARLASWHLMALLALSACSTGSPLQLNPASKATVQSASSTQTEFQKNAIVLRVSSQVGENGIQALEKFGLPQGMNLNEVKVARANLDGRELNPSDVALGTDAKGNVVFFIARSVFTNELAGQVDGKSVRDSATFEQTKAALRETLLTQYKDQIQSVPVSQMAQPAWQKTTVEGTNLIRQMAGALKEDAAVLAKAGIFIDRNFYFVLEPVASGFQTKQVANQAQMFKLDLPANDWAEMARRIQDVQANLPTPPGPAGANQPETPPELLNFPVVNEPINNDGQAFTPINPEDVNKVLGIEEAEEDLENEIGPELEGAKTGPDGKRGPAKEDLSQIEIKLDLNDLKAVGKKRPELLADPLANAPKAPPPPPIKQVLEAAHKNAGEVQQGFQAAGCQQIPDQKLFDPAKAPPRPLFPGFQYQQPASQFQLPPPRAPQPGASGMPQPSGGPSQPPAPPSGAPQPPAPPSGAPQPSAPPSGAPQPSAPPPSGAPMPAPPPSGAPQPSAPPPSGAPLPPPPSGF